MRSAHRTPDAAAAWARAGAAARPARDDRRRPAGPRTSRARWRRTARLPVLGRAAREQRRCSAFDALLATVQMPPGVPVGTLGGRDVGGAQRRASWRCASSRSPTRRWHGGSSRTPGAWRGATWSDGSCRVDPERPDRAGAARRGRGGAARRGDRVPDRHPLRARLFAVRRLGGRDDRAAQAARSVARGDLADSRARARPMALARRYRTGGGAADPALLAGPAVADLPGRADRAARRVRGAGGRWRCAVRRTRCATRCSNASAGRSCRAARTSRASRPPRPPRTSCGSSATSSTWCSTAGRDGGMPSTLVDVSGRAATLLRQGAAGRARRRSVTRDETARRLIASAGRRRLTRSSSARSYPRRDVSADTLLRVLFVCTGNTCRSPMAAAALRQALGAEADRVLGVSRRAPPPGRDSRPTRAGRTVAARGGVDLRDTVRGG